MVSTGFDAQMYPVSGQEAPKRARRATLKRFQPASRFNWLPAQWAKITIWVVAFYAKSEQRAGSQRLQPTCISELGVFLRSIIPLLQVNDLITSFLEH